MPARKEVKDLTGTSSYVFLRVSNLAGYILLMWLYVSVFLLCALIEFIYVNQTKSLMADDVKAAVGWTGVLHVLTKGSIVLFVFNPYAIPFAVAGHMLGSYAGLKWRQR